MKSLDTISEDLFNKIRGRFPSVTIGTEEGKVTNDPKQARFFDFDYKAEGKTLGKVSISLSDESVSVMYTNSFIENQDKVTKENWYSFLKEIRTFAKKRLLKFDVQDITKSNLDRRDYKFLAQNSGEIQMSESKLYGSNNVSYQNIGSARLNIRHKTAVNPEQPASRTRNIDRIYIESPEGERFKYPYRHLAGARAMARHVSEGGVPYDDFGKHVVGLSEELNNLKKFKTYVGRSRVMAEGLAQYMDIIEGRAKDVKKELESIQKSNGYASIIENYESVVLEDVPEDVKTNWIDELTIRQFNEDLKDVFPYIYRLIGEGTRAEDITPDNFDSALEEDTRHKLKQKMQESLDMDPEKLAQLVDAMASDLVNDDVDSVIEKLDSVLDSDIEKANFLQMIVPNIDVSSESEQKLAAKMQEYERGTQQEDEQETTDEQLPITEFILSHYDKETGAWPRGETAVLTDVEKDYGENYIETAKQFMEKINQTFEQFNGVDEACGCDNDNEEPDSDEDFERLKNLAGL